jgi:hypothetical protein
MNDDSKPAASGPQVPYVRRPWHHRHRHFQPIDEVVMTTVPRWKDSELSGSEYRYHVQVKFKRKGRVAHEFGCRDVETALATAGTRLSDWLESGKYPECERDDDCDQEGCRERATVTYLLKRLVSREGYVKECGPDDLFTARFCDEHRHRGDCGLEDADTNYEEIK